jgi:hypothetical protein
MEITVTVMILQMNSHGTTHHQEDNHQGERRLLLLLKETMAGETVNLNVGVGDRTMMILKMKITLLVVIRHMAVEATDLGVGLRLKTLSLITCLTLVS